MPQCGEFWQLLSETEVSTFYKLPQIWYKYPFDRLIIWQAIHKNMTLISKDKAMKEYEQFGFNVLWS